MTFRIPNQNKQIRQLNINDLLGEIYSSKNILLSDMGYIKLSHPSLSIFNTNDSADLADIDSMFHTGLNEYFISSKVFYGKAGFTAPVSRSSDTNTPANSGISEDGILFNSIEVISDGANIKYLSGDTTWTTLSLSLSTSYPTTMCVSDYFNSLLVANSNTVKMISIDWVNTITLTIPATYIITSIDCNNNTIAVATRHKSSGEAKLFIWYGADTGSNGNFGVNASEIMSVKKYESSFAVITSKGQLLSFTGSGFKELANLPIYYLKTNWENLGYYNANVSHRGMVVDNDDIYVILTSQNADLTKQFIPNFNSGVWRYNPNNGLYPVYSPTFSSVLSDTIPTTDVNTTDNIITVTTAPITGTPVLYDDGASTVLGGLAENKVYYTIKISATTVKLATTYSNAIAGTAIDLTGTGNNAQSLKFILVNDYGWSFYYNTPVVNVSKQGCIDYLTSRIIDNSIYANNIIFASTIFGKQATTAKSVINIVSPLIPNRGYFTTPKLFSQTAKDIYNNFIIKYKPLDVDEKIIVKYRISERIGLPIKSVKNGSSVTGVWSDTNTFTTSLDLSNAQTGDEVEIISGVGAGWTAHIASTPINNSGTWTVELDDSFIYASANDIMYFVIDNWTKYKTITLDNEGGNSGFDSFNIDANGKFIQFKIELYGVDVTVEEIIISNSKLN